MLKNCLKLPVANPEWLWLVAKHFRASQQLNMQVSHFMKMYYIHTLKIHKPSTSLNEHFAGLGVWVWIGYEVRANPPMVSGSKPSQVHGVPSCMRFLSHKPLINMGFDKNRLPLSWLKSHMIMVINRVPNPTLNFFQEHYLRAPCLASEIQGSLQCPQQLTG